MRTTLYPPLFRVSQFSGDSIRRFAIPLLLVVAVAVSPIAALQQPNQGAIRVVVRDPEGLVIPGARVTLAGPVQQEGLTNREGVIVFPGLPPADYRVFSTMPGFTETSLTLTVGAGSIIEQVMRISSASVLVPEYSKPVRHKINTGCRHDGPPVDLRGFVAMADAVAHVRIREQRGEDHVPPRAVEAEVVTRNVVEVVEVFEPHARWPTKGGVAEIVQAGGDVDRGDYIEVVRNICLDLLLVGREYVLFLERSEWYGGWAVLFGEEGAFLIEGERLDALGATDFAQHWDSRVANELLNDLRANSR